MKLTHLVTFEGTIRCITGLAIRGMNNEINIGGADSEVIKNPLTGEPYIPGSSIKGKMRSQLERKHGMYDKNGNTDNSKPCQCGKTDCPTCTIFGAHMNPDAKSAPTRIIVRDATLSEATRKQIESLPLENGSYLEVKAENMIKRDSGIAAKKALRFMERVPAGAEFDFEIILQIFEGDNLEKMCDYVKEGLRLVEQSYLGGSGSRGYGKVEFDYGEPDIRAIEEV